MTDPKEAAISAYLAQVRGRIGDAHTDDAQDWLDHGEWSLAVEVIADGLFEAGAHLDANERDALIAIIESVGYPVSKFSFLKLET